MDSDSASLSVSSDDDGGATAHMQQVLVVEIGRAEQLQLCAAWGATSHLRVTARLDGGGNAVRAVYNSANLAPAGAATEEESDGSDGDDDLKLSLPAASLEGRTLVLEVWGTQRGEAVLLGSSLPLPVPADAWGAGAANLALPLDTCVIECVPSGADRN